MAAGVPANEDARFEVEAAVRGLTEFLVSRHSVAHAQAFWKSLASTTVMKSYQARAEEEARRLAAQR